MDWVLGLDGGGTKTLLALANRQGQVRGPLMGAGINPFDQPGWQQELQGLLAQSPIGPDKLAFSSFGLPGYGESKTVNAKQLQAAHAFAGERCEVLNDVAMAFVGALAGNPGVLILAGTGSMAWASDGIRQLRVGGFGEGFGDEGSAFWIGHQALQKLSWTLDGRLEDEAYRSALLQALSVQDAESLIVWFYGLEHPRSQIARLAQTIDRLAEVGNPTALGVLERAAAELTRLAQTACRLLNNPIANHFSYAGSTFNSRTVREQVRAGLEPLGAWQEPILSPIGGALLHAAGRAGWQVDASWIDKISQGLQGATGAGIGALT